MPLGRLRITYTGGYGPLGSDRGERGPTLLVALGESTRRPRHSTAVITVPWTRNERGALTGLKTTSYAENVVALARAREQGASEALFANTIGQLCEGTGSNVFVVLDEQEVRTPPSPPLSPASRARSPSSGPAPGRPIFHWMSWSVRTRSS